MKESVYWIGKCEKCKYSSDFQDRYGLFWNCKKFDVPMFMIDEHQCPGNAYYPIIKEPNIKH